MFFFLSYISNLAQKHIASPVAPYNNLKIINFNYK